jgi:hypothetical protein
MDGMSTEQATRILADALRHFGDIPAKAMRTPLI